jgi:predicted membrane-bound dolichyl-phosphate-mannose-protein mannosyltransferase
MPTETELLIAPEGSTVPGSGKGPETEDARLRHRLLGYRPTDRFWGWAVPIVIAAIGGFVRFWHLDQPHQLVFDETYYVKQGASYLRVGYELAVNGDSTPSPDNKFTRGTVNVFLNSPDFVVHPPFGKWMIAAGEWLFGPASSWGWRFSAALVGTLSILMIGRIARRMFGSTLLGGTAALLLAVDGEHFVLSRTGLLDVFVMFWALAGFACILIDRDRSRRRLADRISARVADRAAAQVPDAQLALAGTPSAQEAAAKAAAGSGSPPDPTGSGALGGPGAFDSVQTLRGPNGPGSAVTAAAGSGSPAPLVDVLVDVRQSIGERESATGDFGPWLGVRWWRIAAAVCLGLCAGTKWSGLFFAIAFMTAGMLWDFGARRAARVPNWFWGTIFKDTAWQFVMTIVVAPLTYLATWFGWFRSTNAYYRQWAVEHPSKQWGWIPDSLRSLWHYHADMYHFNTTLRSPHVYQSNPWSWTVLGRPTAFYYESYKNGSHGCKAAECSRAITDLGNPVIWWGGTIAIAVLLFVWALGRDWRAGAVLVGVAGGYLPWFNFQARTIYTFYAVAFTPWVVLALTFVLGMMIGPRTAPAHRRLYGTIAAGTIVVLAVLAFAFFWPVLSAQVIPRTDWSARMWLPSWV